MTLAPELVKESVSTLFYKIILEVIVPLRNLFISLNGEIRFNTSTRVCSGVLIRHFIVQFWSNLIPIS
jgi:hypothetical protein